MIRINRGPMPEMFYSRKLMAAKDNLEKSYHNRDRQERLRFDDKLIRQLRDNLIGVFSSKCAYCETKVGVSDPGTLDPFRPRNGARGLKKGQYAPMHYWWLFYEWDNMMLSCSMCNQKYKRDFFPIEEESRRVQEGMRGESLFSEGALLIDPCNENPEEHLSFSEDGTVSAITTKGQVTIDVLGLNRVPLIKDREDKAKQLRRNLDSLPAVRTASKKLLEQYQYIEELFQPGSTQEYAALQRATFTNWYHENSSLWDKIKDSQNKLAHVSLSSAYEKSVTDIEINTIKEDIESIKRFSIKSFSIENFKSIGKLELSIRPVDEKSNDKQRESWLLVLGDNGIGKSSILQALTLALCGSQQLKKLELDVDDFLKRGQKNGSVIIYSYESEVPVTLYFDCKGFRSSIVEPATYVMAYGSTRLLPKKSIQPDNDKEPYANVRNLFDYSISLENPATWLNSLTEEEFNERVVPAFYDVLALRGKDRLYRDDGKINISHYNNENELEDTSDGYKTIVALVADIMQTLSVELAGYHNSSGIVLIDEIGNHLHPRWRAKIVGAVRNAFPNLQFIVTTHEPLCLRGLSKGEVVVMVRDKNNEVRCLDSSLLPDHSVMRIEQLLTSDLFGLIDVMDSDIEKSFEEYYQLLSKATESISDDEKEKIEELRIELKDKELLGNNLREQVLLEVIDSSLAQKIKQDGFVAQETLKKETITLVKGFIEDNYKDIL